MSRLGQVGKVFRSTVGSKHIHEAVLMVGTACEGFSAAYSYGGKGPDTPMVAASVGKLFTTACILILQEQGKLSLQDRAAAYFDETTFKGLHVYKGMDYSFQLTLGDLLFQTSGLPDYFEEGASTRNRVLREDYQLPFGEKVALTKSLRPHFAPRSQGRSYYSDLNFDLLGEIVEQIAGLPLDQAYHTMIFGPLGMERTMLPAHTEYDVPGIYYKDLLLKRPQAVMSYRGSGGCISTARDLLVFIRAFFEGRLFAGGLPGVPDGYRKLQMAMGPLYYGGGYMQLPMRSVYTLYRGKEELLGHSGTTGSFAFYYPHAGVYFTGDLNQMARPSYPIQLIMKLAKVFQ